MAKNRSKNNENQSERSKMWIATRRMICMYARVFCLSLKKSRRQKKKRRKKKKE